MREVSLREYTKVSEEIKDVVERIAALTPEQRKQIWPQIMELRAELKKLLTVLRQKMDELGIEYDDGGEGGHMNWYPKER